MSFGANTPLLTHFAVVTKHSAEFPVGGWGGGEEGETAKGIYAEGQGVCGGGWSTPQSISGRVLGGHVEMECTEPSVFSFVGVLRAQP